MEHKCNICESKLVVYKGDYSVNAYCTKCFKIQYISSNNSCCINPKVEPVKFPMRGGGMQIRKQCRNCGDVFGLALKKKDFDINKLNLYDNNRMEEYRKNNFKETEEFNRIFEEYKAKNYTFEHKFPGYNEYLASDLWQTKRRLVLERDKYVCQSCIKAKAIQVHHLSYEHVFNEPLFELTSVCIRCHEIITNMDRKKEADSINH